MNELGHKHECDCGFCALQRILNAMVPDNRDPFTVGMMTFDGSVARRYEFTDTDDLIRQLTEPVQ